MFLRVLVVAVIACTLPALLHAQLTGTPATLDGSFQVKIFPNLAVGDSVINIGNTGAVTTTVGSFGAVAGGNICVNIYVFSPDEQEVACCTCVVTPNGVMTVSTRQLISRPMTPAVPTAITVKLVSTVPTSPGSCNAASPTIAGATGTAPGALAIGMIAFGTNVHVAPVGGSVTAGTYALTETAFVPSTLSSAELTRITTLCGFIQTNGSGFGLCPGCTLGAAGAVRE